MSNPVKPSVEFDLRDAAPSGMKPVINRGLYVAGGCLGVFMLWGLFVPLSSAVIADGEITSNGQNKVMQHISGGRIKTIEAVDGARLSSGETIMVLDPVVSRAEFSQLQARRDTLMALEARLQALTGGSFTLAADFSAAPNYLSGEPVLRGSAAGLVLANASADSGPLENVYDAQRLELQYDREALGAEYRALQHQIDILHKDRKAKQVRSRALADSLEVARVELGSIRSLVEQGFLPRKDLWLAVREEGRIAAEAEEAKAALQGLNEKIGEAQNRLISFVAGKKRDATKDLTQVLGELAEIRDRIDAARQALNHTEIKAPVDGTLVKFSTHTIGGVVRGGEPIGEIVPDGAELIVEARILPKDIAAVEIGQSARAVVSALNKRKFDPLETKIDYISADSIADEKTGEKYFLVRAKVANAPIDGGGDQLIKPGMKVVLYVDAGSKSFLGYVTQPLADSFARAFSEN
ncbi:MAG: HlyD family type I secretion periplasmic adaptor subunit [Rhizobiaceae bacterium]